MSRKNIVSIYRKEYLESRSAGACPDQSHMEALEAVRISLLYGSAVNKMPVADRDLLMLEDLQNNPHYKRLLEDTLDLDESSRKDYLQHVSKKPLLRLVK